MIWTCKGCSFSLELSEEQKIAFCPNCGHSAAAMKKNDLPSESAGEGKQEGENISLEPVNCSYCGVKILPGEERVVCPDCRTVYHPDCWEENHGCATYGCKSAPSIEVHAQGQIPCPHCYTMLSMETIICPSCGNRIDGKTEPLQNVHNVLFSEKSKLCSWFSAWQMKEQILKPICDCLQLLWQDACHFYGMMKPYLLFLFKSYANAFCQYASYNGITGRAEFLCYVIVTSAVYVLLFTVPGNNILGILYLLITCIPTIAVTIRRLHDIKLSGWFILAIPVLLLLLLTPSRICENNITDCKERSKNDLEM